MIAFLACSYYIALYGLLIGEVIANNFFETTIMSWYWNDIYRRAGESTVVLLAVLVIFSIWSRYTNSRRKGLQNEDDQ